MVEMALNVNPGDTVRVSFTLTNTGNPVSDVADDTLFEDYEAVANGQIPSGWTGNVWASTNDAHEGSKSLRVNSDYLEDNYRTLPDLKGIVTIDVWHHPKLGDDTNSNFNIGDGINHEALWHKNDQDKWWYHPGSIYFAEYDGLWTHFRAEINTNTNQYSLWMNDVLIVSNHQLSLNYSNGIKRIHIHSGRGREGTDSYFDNLSVMVGAPQGFYIPVLFVNPSRTDGFVNEVYSGAMSTGQAKPFSVDLVVPTDITVDVYNLEIDVWDPGLTEIIASAVVSNAINIIGLDVAVLTDDAFVRNEHPDDNYGGMNVLDLAFSAYWDYYDDIYLKFSVPNITITSAVLVLRVVKVDPGESGTIVAVNSADTWSEDTITWNNRPTLLADELYVEANAVVGTDYYVTFDVTDFIKTHLGENVTIAIIGLTEEVEVKFSSKEGDYPPEIQIS